MIERTWKEGFRQMLRQPTEGAHASGWHGNSMAQQILGSFPDTHHCLAEVDADNDSNVHFEHGEAALPPIQAGAQDNINA